MPDERDALTAALAERYRVERELGRGGMATVYLAEDLKHRRPVAIKLLKPELAAAIGPERFLREIEISARLDHPHILPLYDSGEANGLLFYVMPYVEGESLRDRLNREKQLPLDDALQIAREVADALSYAHSRDVVHRDIKPENIMLAGGHARVADFGIARAITAAGGAQLTETGLAVGTPTYMSPEQAGGASELDGRSDLYSLGCVLYEMLAGQAPFTGPTVESVIHQHMTSEPRTITSVRPAVPASVASALARVLSKTPADRFSPAAQFAEALASQPAASAPPPAAAAVAPVWRRRPMTLATIGIAIVAVGFLALRSLGVGSAPTLISTGAIEARERLILADFDNRTSESTQGATVTELIRIGLSQSQAVSIVDPLQLSRILQMMRRDPSDGVPSAVALEAAEREGMKGVITGEVVTVGSGLAISARLITTDGAVLVAETENAAGADDLLAAVDRLSDRLRERFGESLRTIRASRPLEDVTTGSMRALRVFSQGLQAWNQGDNARALQLLGEAIAEDSTFAMAWRKLAIILSNSEAQRSRAVAAATRAYDLRDRLTERERYLVTAAYHTVVTGNRDQQISAYRTVLDLHPDDVYALNNLGVVYGQLRDLERSAELYARALGVDSTLRLHYSNYSGALARQKKFDSAAVIARRFEARFPENPEVKLAYVLNAAYRQDYDSARGLVQGLLDDQRGTVWWEAIAYEWWGHLDALGGRLASAQRLWRRAFNLTSEQGLRGQYLARAARRAIVERLLLGDSSRAVRLLDEALRLHPLGDLPPLDRPYGRLAVAYAAAGQPQRARALLAEYESASDADRSEDALLWMHGGRGVIALAEGRIEEAIDELRRFDDGNECWTCAYPWLARAYDRLGEEDSVRVLYERFTEIPSADLWYDGAHLAHSYMRLGELYEERGERERAAQYYGRFISLWDRADPELQEWVRQAREALARVTAEPRGTD